MLIPGDNGEVRNTTIGRAISERILDFCIPTFNNAEELDKTLRSIIPQIIECNYQCEIVISDNASLDQTTALCSAFQETYPFVRYFRNNHNLGFDANFLLSLRRAQSTYCWPFGDDILLDGALGRVLQLIQSYNPTLLSANYAFTLDGKYIANKALARAMARVTKLEIIQGPAALISNRKHWYGFMSSNVCIRESSVISSLETIQTRNYAHMYYIAEITKKGSSLLVPETLVVTQWSSSRPAESSEQVPRTFMINLPAVFADLADQGVISNELARNAISEVDRTTFPGIRRLLSFKLLVRTGKAEKQCYDAILQRLPDWKRFLAMFTPVIFLKLVFVMKRELKTLRGQNQMWGSNFVKYMKRKWKHVFPIHSTHKIGGS